jgi:hypothetical protein
MVDLNSSEWQRTAVSDATDLTPLSKGTSMTTASQDSVVEALRSALKRVGSLLLPVAGAEAESRELLAAIPLDRLWKVDRDVAESDDVSGASRGLRLTADVKRSVLQ